MKSPSESSDVLDNVRLELRRGCLVLAALAALRSEQYGYTLRKTLADEGLQVDEGTLYPLLRRLESQGLLSSQWREENKRPKRFYKLSPAGRQTLAALVEDWRALDHSLDNILGDSDATARSLPRRR